MADTAKTGSLSEQKAALKARLAKLEKQEKSENEKRMVIVGRAALDEAENDPDFQRRLNTILERRVTKKRDQRIIGLPEKTEPQSHESQPLSHHS